nr:MAG TPA: hypothetical protein [Caudoviricetes sp.]DAZ43882.1 MAG TPA: hypothetical protein [Caudoviricetes sp.]
MPILFETPFSFAPASKLFFRIVFQSPMDTPPAVNLSFRDLNIELIRKYAVV